MTPLEEASENQRIASHPLRSVFVLANAGSGKTRVLTNRVARLLLAETEPQKILCITFTKAAAAEMADRLFSVLGKWALADDGELVAALEEVEGEDAAKRTPDDLAEARRLFARALETPGGLKIQTIHSFCEGVLRRFPIEAGAPPGFSVIEDADALAVQTAAIDSVAAEAAADSRLAAAFARLSMRRSENSLRSLIIEAAKACAALPGDGDPDRLRADLASACGVDPALTEGGVKAAFVGRVSEPALRRAYEALADTGGNPGKAAVKLGPYFTAGSIEEKWAALANTFLKADQSEPLQAIATKAMRTKHPVAADFIEQSKSAFWDETLIIRAISALDDTTALFDIASRVRRRYDAAKAARAALDFDDLIARTSALFCNLENAWVMYKLDHGVDHILVDEAQDTSAAQWAVVESLFADFLSGAGARTGPRSFFAVGDLKQSIYSFQGADAMLFKEKEQHLGSILAAVTEFRSVPLAMSFRTTEPVLSFVDAAFSPREAAEGLGDHPIPRHQVRREGQAGLVELWPLTPYPDRQPVEAWDAPVDAPGDEHPTKVLCQRVAETISGWIASGEVLSSQGRPVSPRDILILVQSRRALFTEVIRQLAIARVPVAGPDRLKLLEDPAVEDLLSYARFVVTPDDDLSLAELLKSPLFGCDDDADLFALAASREPGASLWTSLSRRAGEKPRWRDAAAMLKAAMSVARREGPYAFFTHVLECGAPSGRRRFHDRLGGACDDAIDELLRQTLAFENGEPRSLRAFLAWFESASGEIKRETDRESDAVRVMTVHGAKGLEADIVFLLDAHRTVNSGKIGPLLKGAPPLLAWSKHSDCAAAAARRADLLRLEYEEYRRLFYVAATRARDRLYICGVETGRSKKPESKPVGEKSWHALAVDAFEALGARVKRGAEPFWQGGAAPVLRIDCPQDAPGDGKSRAGPGAAPTARPDWLHSFAPAEAAPIRLAPSRLAGETDEPVKTASAAFSPLAGKDRYFRGRVLHRMLELLPDLDPAGWPEKADGLLRRLAGDVAAEERARWREEVLAVLTDPAFAAVFAPGAVAEAPIAGRIGGATLVGQIDRLAVTATQVLIVDYKTNRPPPLHVRDADPSYVAQLAAYRRLMQEIYPDREIRCALLWTFAPRLMDIPAEMLDHAFAQRFPTA